MKNSLSKPKPLVSTARPIMEIEWVDSMVINPPWTHLPSMNWKMMEKNMQIKTVGYLIQETERIYVLTQSIKPHDPVAVGPSIMIPKIAVKKVRKK